MGLANSSYRSTVVRSKPAADPSHVTMSRDEHELLRAALAVLLSPLDAIDANIWRGQVGAALCDLVGGDRSAFKLDAPGLPLFYSEDYSQKILDAYVGYYASIDVTEQRRRQLGVEVWNRALLLGDDARDFKKSEIYHDYFAPNGMADAMGLSVSVTGTPSDATVVLHRERANTPEFGDRGLALLGLLLPAFKAGVRDLLRYSAQRDSFVSHIDSLGEGIRIYDLAGKLVHQNPAFASMTAEYHGQKIEKSIDDVLQALLAVHESGNLLATAGRRVSHEVNTGAARYEVRGSLLGRELLGTDRKIAIALHRMPVSTALSDHALQERYKLTTRELEITRRLAQGQSTKELAHELGISLHTVRRHTESIFNKLGVRTRSQIGPKLRAG